MNPKKILIYLSFFPFINFGAGVEIIPVGSILLAMLYFKRKIFFVAAIISFVIFFLIHNYNLAANEIMITAIAVLLTVSLLECNINISAKMTFNISLGWFISILASNLSSFTNWEALAPTMFARVYVCDLPLNCSRGGSGLSPEPAYAATVIIFIGLYNLYLSKNQKNKLFIFTDAILYASLVLLNVLVGYIGLLMLVFLRVGRRLSFKSIALIIPLIVIVLTMLTHNTRLQSFQNIDIDFSSLGNIFAVTAIQGSTREIGTYCGYNQSSLISFNTSTQEKRFSDCQNELFGIYRSNEDIEGFKPYSPIAFISLYYGIIPGLLLLIYMVIRIYRSMTSFEIIPFLVLFLISTRSMVALSVPFLVIAAIINHMNQKKHRI